MKTAALTAALPTASPPELGALFSQGRLGACIGVLALVSLLAFEAMAVAAAMPAIAQALHGIALYALAFGGMLAASLLGMVLAGSACDRHGPLRATAAGLGVFTAGLLLAGFANHMGWLVAGRVVQGLGAGMLSVALYVGIGQLVPQPLHPRLFALLAAAWVLPALLGPMVAAWLVGWVGWRAVFLVVAAAVPLAAALVLPAFARLPRPATTAGDATVPHNRIGRIGWAALGAMGALLLHVASQASAAPVMLLTLALGLAAACMAARQLLPRGSLMAAPGLPAVIALRGLLAAAFASAEVFLPLYLTREAGWSLAQAGLALSAGAVLWSCGSAVQARIVAPRARRRGLQLGFLAVAAGMAVVAIPMLLGHSAWVVVAGWSVVGFGIGLSFPMLSVLTLSLSAPAEQGRHASALQLSDAFCSSAALAVASALYNQAGGGGAGGHVLVLGLSMAMTLAGAMLGRRAFASVPAGGRIGGPVPPRHQGPTA